MDAAKVRLTIPQGIDPALVTGGGDCILRAVDAMKCGEALVRGDSIQLSGSPDEVEKLTRLFTQLIKMASAGQVPSSDDADRIMEALRHQDFAGAGFADDIILTYRGRAIRPKTAGQKAYIDAIRSNTVTFCLGPAGTGKTYLAVAAAVDALERQEIRRILLTRPAVEAGEKLGFLPGDLSQKVDPYLRPLYDALFEMLGFEKVEKLIERNVIEVAPLAYMRGRTLNDAFIILDESQNTTIEQMKMFLTRIGFNSKAVITGDITQIDLPRSTKSGLRHAIEVLAEVDEISFNFFHSEDVVRHPVVARIVNAYEAWEAADQKRKAELAAERKREAQEQEQK